MQNIYNSQPEHPTEALVINLKTFSRLPWHLIFQQDAISGSGQMRGCYTTFLQELSASLSLGKLMLL